MSDSAAHRHPKPFIALTSKTKTLHFSVAEVQSRMNLRQPDLLELEYTRIMMGFLLFNPEPKRIAMLGLGGGSLAKFCYRYMPTADICVVEINPYVIALRDEFLVPPDNERFQVIEADGAEFVRGAPARRFDVALVDGYDSDGLPGGLCSQEFFDGCCAMLEPNGFLVVNLHYDHKHYEQHIDRIYRSFHGAVLVVDNKREGNGVVFAQKIPLANAFLMRPLRRPQTLDESAWKSLQGSVVRIQSALREGPY